MAFAVRLQYVLVQYVSSLAHAVSQAVFTHALPLPRLPAIENRSCYLYILCHLSLGKERHCACLRVRVYVDTVFNTQYEGDLWRPLKSYSRLLVRVGLASFEGP